MELPLDHFFRVALSIDIVLFTYHEKKLKVLLKEKSKYLGQQEIGLVGKLMMPNENADRAMNSLLKELIGTNDFYKKQLEAFSDVGRHPLGRVVTFAYYGLVPFERVRFAEGAGLHWSAIKDARSLSYDHDLILENVFTRFRKGLLQHPTVFELLSEEFVLTDIIKIYEQAFDREFDHANFRSRLRRSKLIIPSGRFSKDPISKGRPAELHRYDRNEGHGLFKETVQFNF